MPALCMQPQHYTAVKLGMLSSPSTYVHKSTARHIRYIQSVRLNLLVLLVDFFFSVSRGVTTLDQRLWTEPRISSPA